MLHGLSQGAGLGVPSSLTGSRAVKPIYRGGCWARLETLLPETRRQEETVDCLTQQQRHQTTGDISVWSHNVLLPHFYNILFSSASGN